jgi:hypothetical protein
MQSLTHNLQIEARDLSDAPIFIVGCPRSGTTLRRSLLRSHPRITFPNESQCLPRFYRAYGDPCNSQEGYRVAARFLQMPRIRFWGLPLDPSDFVDCRSCREIFSRVYQAWACREGKSRWGDKTPEYVEEIPTLLEIFPNAKIIHLYRDGRDVALSWTRQWFGPSNIYVAARLWKRCVSAGLQVGATLSPENYLEIRYETLLSEAEATMRWICAFLNEPFSPKVITPNFLETRDVAPRLGTWPPSDISTTQVITANAMKWRQAMLPAERIVFESVAGDLLSTLGYPTEGKRRHISAFEKAKWEAQNVSWRIWNRLNTKRKTPWIRAELTLRYVRCRALLRKRLRSRSARGELSS